MTMGRSMLVDQQVLLENSAKNISGGEYFGRGGGGGGYY